MHKYNYADADACFFEAMRVNMPKTENARTDGHARIDKTQTEKNVVLIINPCMDTNNFKKQKLYGKERYHSGDQIAAYHKFVTGKAARMNGKNKQLSKAIGLIITIPEEYLSYKRPELSEEEEVCLCDYIENGKKIPEELAKKLTRLVWSEDEVKTLTEQFFIPVYESFLKIAGIREDDVLFAVIHFDETTPHLHIMALPTIEKEYEEDVCNKRSGWLLHKAGEKQITFSMDRFNYHNKEDGKSFFESFHERLIEELQSRNVPYADRLLNGATDKGNIDINRLSREQRDEGILLKESVRWLKKQKKKEIEEIEHLYTTVVALEEESVPLQQLFVTTKDSVKSLKKDMEEIAEKIQNDVTGEISIRLHDLMNDFVFQYHNAKTAKEREDLVLRVQLNTDEIVYKTVCGSDYSSLIDETKNRITILEDALELYETKQGCHSIQLKATKERLQDIYEEATAEGNVELLDEDEEEIELE